MLHPATELGSVNPDIGVGVFANAFIPQGTIVYTHDPLEIEIAENDDRLKHPALRELIERYSYTTPTGTRVISWDLAKYVNHSCDPNILSTGYGFEIAVRDIQSGDEITDDYGLLNIENTMPCSCGSTNCREWIKSDDLLNYCSQWDLQVKEALRRYQLVKQPLVDYIDEQTLAQLNRYLATNKHYLSVDNLSYLNFGATG